MGFSSIDTNSSRILKCWSLWSLLWSRVGQFWVLKLFRKLCVVCSLPLAAIMCLLLLKPTLLPIVRFCCPLFLSTLFCILAFLRFWRPAQKVNELGEVPKKSYNETVCKNANSVVDQNSTALKHQGLGVETPYCRQVSEFRPKSWVAYVRGSETDRESIWFLEKTPRAELSFEGVGTVTVDEDFIFSESLKTTEEDNAALMENFGKSIQKLIVKLQADGKLEEEMIKGAQADVKSNAMPEQERVNSASMVSDIKGSNFSFSRQLKSPDESHSEDSDEGSSAWEQTLDSSENGSSSTWHRGSDNSDIRAAALDKESSIWKMGTIHSDQESAAPELSFRRIKNKSYTRLIYSSGWDSDESFDPYVSLFAEDENVSNVEDEGVSDVKDSRFPRQQPYDNPLRERPSAFHQNFLGASAASYKCTSHSKRRSLRSICKAFRNFLRRISGQKIRFFRK